MMLKLMMKCTKLLCVLTLYSIVRSVIAIYTCRIPCEAMPWWVVIPIVTIEDLLWFAKSKRKSSKARVLSLPPGYLVVLEGWGWGIW